MAIVGPTEFPAPPIPPDLSVAGPVALATGETSPVEEFAAKVTRFIRLMGPVLEFLVQNPEVAPAARNLFSSLANTAKEEKRKSGDKQVTGPIVPGLPAPPMLVPPGPGAVLPGPSRMIR